MVHRATSSNIYRGKWWWSQSGWWSLVVWPLRAWRRKGGRWARGRQRWPNQWCRLRDITSNFWYWTERAKTTSTKMIGAPSAHTSRHLSVIRPGRGRRSWSRAQLSTTRLSFSLKLRWFTIWRLFASIRRSGPRGRSSPHCKARTVDAQVIEGSQTSLSIFSFSFPRQGFILCAFTVTWCISRSRRPWCPNST